MDFTEITASIDLDKIWTFCFPVSESVLINLRFLYKNKITFRHPGEHNYNPQNHKVIKNYETFYVSENISSLLV